MEVGSVVAVSTIGCAEAKRVFINGFVSKKIEMNSKTAAIAVYEILSKYYFATDKYYDQLASMLGDIIPDEFGPNDSFSMLDRAVYADWEESWDKIVGRDKDATPNQVYEVAKTILDYYANEVEYELGDADAYLMEQLFNGDD